MYGISRPVSNFFFGVDPVQKPVYQLDEIGFCVAFADESHRFDVQIVSPGAQRVRGCDLLGFGHANSSARNCSLG